MVLWGFPGLSHEADRKYGAADRLHRGDVPELSVRSRGAPAQDWNDSAARGRAREFREVDGPPRQACSQSGGSADTSASKGHGFQPCRPTWNAVKTLLRHCN